MSERSLTIWKLLITFSVLSIVAGGFSLYPKNKKYQKIIEILEENKMKVVLLKAISEGAKRSKLLGEEKK